MVALRCSVFAALVICASCRPGDNDVLHTPLVENKSKSVSEPSTIAPATSSSASVSTLSTIPPTSTVPKEVYTTVKDQTTVVPSTAYTQTTVAPSSVAPKLEPSAEKVKDETKNNKNEPIPVNELYPSAVLYGGTCGGTIISPTWILTAAHCTLFTGESYGYVLAGTNNTDDGTGVTHKIKRQVVHPRFSVGPYWLDADEFNIKQVAARWDFMLAELEEPLQLNGKTLAVAKLDDQATHRAGQLVGYAGYGTDHFGGYMRSDMHEMLLEIQADEVCGKALEQYNSKDMICTKGRQPRLDAACSGDSGSGLMDESGHLLGVASWVENDARSCFNGALVVFSRVASVRDWIRHITDV